MSNKGNRQPFVKPEAAKAPEVTQAPEASTQPEATEAPRARGDVPGVIRMDEFGKPYGEAAAAEEPELKEAVVSIPVQSTVQEKAIEPEAAPETAPVPLSKFDELRAEAAMSSFTELRALVQVYDDYVVGMAPGVMTNDQTIATRNAQLWRATRSVLKSKDAFAPGIRLIMGYFRAYRRTANGQNAALSDVMLMRGLFDTEHNRMAAHVREAYRNVMVVLTAAAGVESVKQTAKIVDLARAFNATDLEEGEKNRAIAFFS